MQKNLLPGHPWAWVYFASFIVLAVFVVVNLFIAVVINNLETAKEQEAEYGKTCADRHDVESHLRQLKDSVEKLEEALQRRPSQTDAKTGS